MNNGSFSFPTQNNSNENERGAAFLVRILQYLETPQYLRKALFPKHNSLRYVVRIKFYYKFADLIKFFCCCCCFSFNGSEVKVDFMFICILQGMLPPLDAPHHLRKHEWAPFREGKFWFVPPELFSVIHPMADEITKLFAKSFIYFDKFYLLLSNKLNSSIVL